MKNSYFNDKLHNFTLPILEAVGFIKVPETPMKNYYKSIADNKDVAKYVMMMSSALSTLKADVMEALQRYSDYSFLWEKDREEAVTVSYMYIMPAVTWFAQT